MKLTKEFWIWEEYWRSTQMKYMVETDLSRMQLNKKSNKNLFLCCSARKNFHGLNRANLSRRGYILSSTKNILIFEQWYHRLQIITETPTNDATDTIVYYTRLYFNLNRSFYPDDEDVSMDGLFLAQFTRLKTIVCDNQ